MKVIKRIRIVSYVMAIAFAYLFVAGAVYTVAKSSLSVCKTTAATSTCKEACNVIATFWPIGIPLWVGVKAGARIVKSGADFAK